MESTLPALRSVQCPKCQKALPGDLAAIGERTEVCPSCRASLLIRRFDALAKPPTIQVSRAESAMTGDAVCFFHPEKKAEISCEQCGRFVCALCDMPIGNRHLCPSCVEGGLNSGKVPEMINRRFVWATAALALGWLPILLFFFMAPGFLAFGPAAIFLGIFAFRKPGSLVRGKRSVAAVLGILGGVLQLCVVAGMMYGFTILFSNR